MPTITIQKHEFEVPTPYAEGHILTAGEASALNQTFAENLRNNFAPKVKAAGDNPDTVALQAALDEYASAYQFGVRNSSGPRAATSNPIEREAISLAKEAIRAKAKEKGVKLDKDKVNELAAALVDKDPQFMTLAEERVAQTKAVVSSSLEALGL